jgi:hypothetical protein
MEANEKDGKKTAEKKPMSEFGGPLVCSKCNFRLAVGRMALCPQCGSRLQASAPAAAPRVPPPTSEQRSTEAVEPPTQVPTDVSHTPAADQSPGQPSAGSRFWRYADITYALLRYLIPGVLCVLVGLVLLFVAGFREIGAVCVAVGLLLLLLGYWVWPRQ